MTTTKRPPFFPHPGSRHSREKFEALIVAATESWPGRELFALHVSHVLVESERSFLALEHAYAVQVDAELIDLRVKDALSWARLAGASLHEAGLTKRSHDEILAAAQEVAGLEDLKHEFVAYLVQNIRRPGKPSRGQGRKADADRASQRR